MAINLPIRLRIGVNRTVVPRREEGRLQMSKIAIHESSSYIGGSDSNPYLAMLFTFSNLDQIRSSILEGHHPSGLWYIHNYNSLPTPAYVELQELLDIVEKS